MYINGGHLQFQIRTRAVKRPPCSNFALLNDHFQFLRSFNVNLNSNLRNIFIFILYFLDLPVEILIFLPVNSEEGESRKRSVNIVLHC